MAKENWSQVEIAPGVTGRMYTPSTNDPREGKFIQNVTAVPGNPNQYTINMDYPDAWGGQLPELVVTPKAASSDNGDSVDSISNRVIKGQFNNQPKRRPALRNWFKKNIGDDSGYDFINNNIYDEVQDLVNYKMGKGPSRRRAVNDALNAAKAKSRLIPTASAPAPGQIQMNIPGVTPAAQAQAAANQGAYGDYDFMDTINNYQPVTARGRAAQNTGYNPADIDVPTRPDMVFQDEPFNRLPTTEPEDPNDPRFDITFDANDPFEAQPDWNGYDSYEDEFGNIIYKDGSNTAASQRRVQTTPVNRPYRGPAYVGNTGSTYYDPSAATQITFDASGNPMYESRDDFGNPMTVPGYPTIVPASGAVFNTAPAPRGYNYQTNGAILTSRTNNPYFTYNPALNAYDQQY